MIPGTTGESCMFKILGLKKVRLSEQSWTTGESDLLSQIVKYEFSFSGTLKNLTGKRHPKNFL